ncbi:jg20125 [Pararge aegeria aegeria]|uniref:Jg20125 protein n=1 Tax=Pararge aegeria aegeria TaxID=348720 RepID=A0A8S4RCC6_9NEOP|nr:jg20125 [Pararge aegeria aegeria]
MIRDPDRWLCFPGGEAQEHGPVFLMEPPARLVFSNSTGARASCAAHGFPTPQLSWQLPDGTQLDDVPGLRNMKKEVEYKSPYRLIEISAKQP